MLLKNARAHKGARLQPNWTGPYNISEVIGKGTVWLCDQSDSSKVLSSLYNLTRLKFYMNVKKSHLSIIVLPPTILCNPDILIALLHPLLSRCHLIAICST